MLTTQPVYATAQFWEAVAIGLSIVAAVLGAFAYSWRREADAKIQALKNEAERNRTQYDSTKLIVDAMMSANAAAMERDRRVSAQYEALYKETVRERGTAAEEREKAFNAVTENTTVTKRGVEMVGEVKQGIDKVIEKADEIYKMIKDVQQRVTALEAQGKQNPLTSAVEMLKTDVEKAIGELKEMLQSAHELADPTAPRPPEAAPNGDKAP